MANTFCFLTGLPPVAVEHWTHGPDVGSVEMTDLQMEEIDTPNPAAPPLQGDRLPHEGLPNKTTSALPADLAIAANLTHQPVLGILYRWQLLRIAPAALAEKLPGRTLPQRLVGPYMVVSVQPPVASVLLPLGRACWRPRRSPLEFPVKLFVRAVVQIGRAHV